MDFKYLDQYLEHRKETLPFLGATVSVGDETVYSRVYGNKNDNGDPYDEHTPLYIYSITKTFTTLCAMLLVERGLLRLLDPVSRYFPEFKEMKLRDGSIAKNPILIDHLFTMRAGFDYNLESPEIKAIQAEREFETQDIVKVLSSRPLLFEPGTAWTYSLCHDLLGALIEKITGMTLGQFMEQEIFAPLGMKETTFHPTEETLKIWQASFIATKVKSKSFGKLALIGLKVKSTKVVAQGLFLP
jgi:CubicO group peptidase (beta-lactamase class C family)